MRAVFSSECLLPLIASLWISCAGSALAVGPDAMSQGSALYQKGDYARARRYFELAANQKPAAWLAYYYLAHCDVKLGDFNRAEQEYKRCMQMESSPAVLKACQAALSSVVEHRKLEQSLRQAGQQEADIEFERRKVATKLVEHAGAEFQKRRDQALSKRAAILEEGKRRAQAVRNKAQEEIRYLADNGNWICRNSQTGQLSVTIPSAVADEIEANAEVEANKIMRDAENRALGVFVPDYDNSVHHFASGFQDKSKSGPKLDHRGTNLYVRSYTHASPARPAQPTGKKLIAGQSATR